ncbi:hypothetical protein FRX31_021291 [Thalictrum thalictroides]|uniref:Uncharacterized protein n=1 Tax=Thalictrum thalictroides TaxID=46969 RepID=A0A7J6VWA3_THATH|nr:hypothetical protein FRX31_021291 [Thalictrum thalictroides]
MENNSEYKPKFIQIQHKQKVSSLVKPSNPQDGGDDQEMLGINFSPCSYLRYFTSLIKQNGGCRTLTWFRSRFLNLCLTIFATPLRFHSISAPLNACVSNWFPIFRSQPCLKGHPCSYLDPFRKLGEKSKYPLFNNWISIGYERPYLMKSISKGLEFIKMLSTKTTSHRSKEFPKYADKSPISPLSLPSLSSSTNLPARPCHYCYFHSNRTTSTFKVRSSLALHFQCFIRLYAICFLFRFWAPAWAIFSFVSLRMYRLKAQVFSCSEVRLLSPPHILVKASNSNENTICFLILDWIWLTSMSETGVCSIPVALKTKGR